MHVLALVVLVASPGLSAFQGTWQLDPAASESVEALGAKVGLSPAMLALAPRRPQQTFTVVGSTLVISGSSLLGRHEERFEVDGETPTQGELLGVAFRVVTTWATGVLESTGRIEVNGVQERLVLRRTLRGEVMTLTIEVGELKVKRVFARLGR
jgi:hypothetical protein